MARYDLTDDGWFRKGKSVIRGNFFMEVVDNFDYLQAFGENTVTRILGTNVLDKYSGYILNWDGRHLCDRCGTVLEEDGSAESIQTAYAMKMFPHLKGIGLCPKCDYDLNKKPNPLIETTDFTQTVWWKQQEMPDDWQQYAWL